MHPIPVPPPQHLLTLVCVASLLIQAGCAPEKRTDTPIDAAAKKVLFIGIDGLRGDGIPNSDTPNLDSLTAQGRWTMFASTQLQASTVSGPGWTSMLTGVDADKHGIVENGGWTGIDRDYPTLIGRAHSLGLSTLTAIHWFPIQLNIIEADVTDKFTLGADEVITDHMAGALAADDYDVHFLALDDVDAAGHSSGFAVDNPAYVAAIETADMQVGHLLTAIDDRPHREAESWLIVVTSDHGGSTTGHGDTSADHRAIPLIVSGDPVSSGEWPGQDAIPGELNIGFVSHMDVHPTIMTHLGFPTAESWGLDGESRLVR